MLRKIFGAKKEEVGEEWWKVHKQELHNPYTSPYIVREIKSRRMSSAGHVAQMGDEKCINILDGKPEGKRTFLRPRHRWKDNIRMDL